MVVDPLVNVPFVVVLDPLLGASSEAVPLVAACGVAPFVVPCPVAPLALIVDVPACPRTSKRLVYGFVEFVDCNQLRPRPSTPTAHLGRLPEFDVVPPLFAECDEIVTIPYK